MEEGETRLKPIKTPGGLFDNGAFFEQVEAQKYLLWAFDEATQPVLTTEPQMVIYDKAYVPLERAPWPLCKEAIPYGDTDQLLQELRGFIYTHLDLPDDKLYDVLAAWIVSTWVNEVWQVVAYPIFLGPTNTGKTRGLEVLHRLCYRAVLSSNISAAILYRMCEQWHPTILLDETEIYNQKEKGDIIGLLNSGYRRGQYAFRCTDKGEIETFDVFGPKALAGTQSPRRTLEGRGILFRMMKNRRKVRLFIDEGHAHTLRCKLLMYRMKTLHYCAHATRKEDLEKSVQTRLNDIFGELMKTLPSLEFADSRLQELFQNILAVSNSGQEAILELMHDIAKSRAAQEMTTEEAEIVRILTKADLTTEDNVILTKDLTAQFNETLSEKEQWNTRRIGWLMKRLGFEGRHTSHGNGWLIDAARLKHLANRYLVGSPPLASETSKLQENHGKSEVMKFFEQKWGRPPTTVEVIEKVRPYLHSAFDEEQLVRQMRARAGLSQDDAHKLFQHFVEKEMIGRDNVGMWHWTTRK